MLLVVPAVLGMVLVTVGFALIWPPLAFIAAGVFCLLIDRRL